MSERRDPRPEPPRATQPLELVQGTLDLLILLSLAGGARHGYEVMRWLRETSGEPLRIEEGALYPALHRLEARGWIESSWGTSENNRRAKFYRLTPVGRRRLALERRSWERYTSAVSRLLAAAAT